MNTKKIWYQVYVTLRSGRCLQTDPLNATATHDISDDDIKIRIRNGVLGSWAAGGHTLYELGAVAGMYGEVYVNPAEVETLVIVFLQPPPQTDASPSVEGDERLPAHAAA